jgi:hypothetical protein
MMEFKDWIARILEITAVFADKELQEKVWLQGESGLTSVTTWDEAYCQFFDDADGDNLVDNYLSVPTVSKEQVILLRNLRDALKHYAKGKGQFVDTHALLSDPEWDLVIQAAKAVIGGFLVSKSGQI